MSSTRFLSMRADPRGGGVALSGVKYMLIGQYAIVLFVTIVSVCISRQVGRIRSSQVGGREPAVLVMQSQPIDVTRRFGLLRSELLKQPGIEAVTTAMQLPGSAIRDGVMVQKEGESEDNVRRIAVLVVGDDFLPFFRLRPVAGEAFGRLRHTADEEERMLVDAAQGHRTDNGSEQYVVNRSAAEMLGFRTPDEAIALIEEKRTKESQRHIKTFAEEPGLEILNGRYGAYIAFEGSNYRLPKDVVPADLTLEDCRRIIAEAADKPKRRVPRRRSNG